MITAREAIKLAEEYESSYEKTFDKINREIREESKRGRRNIILQESKFPDKSWRYILEEIIKKLEKLGYEVKSLNGEYIMISWYKIKE